MADIVESTPPDPRSVEKYLAAELPPPPIVPDLRRERPLWKRILLWFAPNLTAFIASFCIMVLELVAGRVIARYMGSSLYTWTSVIGIVLAGITIGNLVGGRLADRFRPATVLAVLFLCASGTCFLITPVNVWVNKWEGWRAKQEDTALTGANATVKPSLVGPLFLKALFLFADEDDRIVTDQEKIADLNEKLSDSSLSAEEKAPLKTERENLEKELKKNQAKYNAQRKLPWSAHIFGHVLLVFLLPATILGTIGPVVAKMALDQGRQVGRTVGNVYAWGALGSIVGTFVTGFYLIAVFKTQPTILGVAFVLFLVGVAYTLKFFWPYAFPAAAAGVFFFSMNSPWEWVKLDGRTVLREKLQTISEEGESITREVYVDESQYTYMKIVKTMEKGEETERDLYMDSLIHAELNPRDPTDLRYDYEKIYQSVTHRFGPSENAERGDMACLFLGGGGYVYPRYIRAKWPNAHIEIAEIDPAVTAADVAEFGLSADAIQVVKSPADLEVEGNPIWVHHLDARNHVDDLLLDKASGKPVPQFDFIYGDAFNFLGVPFHLTTKEFTAKVKTLLKPGRGIYMVNIIEIFKSGKFLGAVYNTFCEVFGKENVFIFGNNEKKPSENRDTYIVIGSLQTLPLEVLAALPSESPHEFEGCLLNTIECTDSRDPRKRPCLDVLTDDHHAGDMVLLDDYAPVENLLRYVVDRWK